MAITIHQQPDFFSAISTPLIITASSTNSGLDGFKYVVEVVEGSTSISGVFYVSPNPNGYLITNIAPYVKKWMRNSPRSPILGGSVHGFSNDTTLTFFEQPYNLGAEAGVVRSNVLIREGYNVDGVFTIDPTILVNTSYVIHNFQDFTTRNGFQPDLLATIGHEEGDQSRLMSDRLPSTFKWDHAESEGLNASNAIYIPVRESDWGVWDVRQLIDVDDTKAVKFKLSILPNTGAPVNYTQFYAEDGNYTHMAIYPANLNASTIVGLPKPSDYPNWRAIFFQIFNIDDEQVSMTYVMFNVDRPKTGICTCHEYEPVRLAWVGRRGGWEYYNFNLLNETEYNVDRKVAKRVVGNYGAVGSGTDFTFNNFDESEYVTYAKIEKFITCNTDRLQPGEWEFLKGLILSKQVHWVHDDGTHTPVLIQDTNFKVRNLKAKSLEPLMVKFKIAQDQSN